jgi:peptide/nickel transport system substrate-binding protein
MDGRRYLLKVVVLLTIAMTVAGIPGLKTHAQDGGGTEADLGTSYFLTVKDFEAATGTTMTFHEAPVLAEQVAAGSLPPLEERLPEDPEVVVPYGEMGVYGGVWKTVEGHPRFRNLTQDIMTDGLMQFSRDLQEVRPNLLTKLEFTDDGKTMVMTFRKGLKWSDGEPFSTEDIQFAWEDIINNEDYQGLTPGGDHVYPVDGLQNVPPVFAYNNDGSPAELEVIDADTVAFHYKEAHYGAQYNMNWWLQGYSALLRAKHYLSQFHPKYNTALTDYSQLAEKDRIMENADYPVLWAWRIKEVEVGVRMVLERNPYYWKVDTAGNQLPYIDTIEVEVVEDGEVRLLKILNGEYDATFRGANDPNNLPLFKEKEAEGVIKTLLWGYVGGFPIYVVNQTFNAEQTGDTFMRQLLQSHDFMCAVSHALDRDRIDAVVNNGMGQKGQATLPASENIFQGEEGQQLLADWRGLCAEFDQDLASQLLDGLGLDKRDSDGFRLRPDGSPLTIAVDGYPMDIPKLDNDWPLLFEEALEAVGLRVDYLSYAPTQWAEVVDRARQGLTEITLNDIYGMPCCNVMSFPDYIFPVAGLADGRNWVRIRTWLWSQGKDGEAPEPGSPAEKLVNLYAEAAAQPTLEEANKYVREAIRVHIEYGPFIGGLAGDTPDLVIIKNTFHNVPEKGAVTGWIPQGPAYTDPEQYFIQ